MIFPMVDSQRVTIAPAVHLTLESSVEPLLSKNSGLHHDYTRCYHQENSRVMLPFKTGGSDVGDSLQQTVHGLVQEFFEMLGSGEAGQDLMYI